VEFSPYAVVALRTGLAAALLLVLIIVRSSRGNSFTSTRRGLIGCLLAGMFNGSGSIFYYVGLSKLNASVAQMLYALYPFFVAFWLQLDGQPPSRLTVIRIVIAGHFQPSCSPKWTPADIDLLGVVVHADRRTAVRTAPACQPARVLYDVPAPTVTVYTLLAMSVVVVPAYFIYCHPAPPQPNAPWLPMLGTDRWSRFFSRL
jgi:uncharacterized membrane protein